MKRSGMPSRKQPMRRGTSPMKRSRIKPKRPDPATDEQWQKVRREVADRWWCEGGTPACQRGRHRGEHAHHVILRSRGGPDEAWNLKWLCHAAHTWVHANPDEATARGLMSPRATMETVDHDHEPKETPDATDT